MLLLRPVRCSRFGDAGRCKISIINMSVAQGYSVLKVNYSRVQLLRMCDGVAKKYTYGIVANSCVVCSI